MLMVKCLLELIYMRKLFILLLFCITTLFARAQWYDIEKVNHKANTIYNLGINKAQNGEYTIAIKMIEESLKIEPRFVDAYLSLAGIDAELKNYTNSVIHYQKALELDSIYSNYYLLPYSISLAGCGRFDEALQAINLFLENKTLNDRSIKAGQFRKKTYEFAVAFSKNPNS